MKRDFDLIREILLNEEELHDGGSRVVNETEYPKYSNNILYYHYKLLFDEDLLDGKCEVDLSGGATIISNGLTWLGHDYLANIRSNVIWSKVKATIVQKGLDFTIDIVAQLAAKYTKEMLKI